MTQALSLFEGRVSLPVHAPHKHTDAFHQAPSSRVAEAALADTTIKRGHFHSPTSRHSWGCSRKLQPRTTEMPSLTIVQSAKNLKYGKQAGTAGLCIIDDLSEPEAFQAVGKHGDLSARLKRDGSKSFMSPGDAFATRDTVRQCEREHACGPVHTNSVEGFNDRIRQTIVGTFQHISPPVKELHFNESGLDCSCGRHPRPGHAPDTKSTRGYHSLLDKNQHCSKVAYGIQISGRSPAVLN